VVLTEKERIGEREEQRVVKVPSVVGSPLRKIELAKGVLLLLISEQT